MTVIGQWRVVGRDVLCRCLCIRSLTSGSLSFLSSFSLFRLILTFYLLSHLCGSSLFLPLFIFLFASLSFIFSVFLSFSSLLSHLQSICYRFFLPFSFPCLSLSLFLPPPPSFFPLSKTVPYVSLIRSFSLFNLSSLVQDGTSIFAACADKTVQMWNCSTNAVTQVAAVSLFFSFCPHL